jgi:hypothetical protein
MPTLLEGQSVICQKERLSLVGNGFIKTCCCVEADQACSQLFSYLRVTIDRVTPQDCLCSSTVQGDSTILLLLNLLPT